MNNKPRARDLGIPFRGTPGAWNAITDIDGVTVGQVTLISGEGALKVGAGPVRTGVTAIWPRGKESLQPVFAGWFSLNGNGEMTGTTWIEESGFLNGPIVITNTHSVGAAHEAVIAWQVAKNNGQEQPANDWWLPLIAETYDGYLNDINGFHIKQEHVFNALNSATSGPVAEGNVGGGTGMIAFAFKGGIGTSSRIINIAECEYKLAVLVQANFGRRHQLQIAGVPVGLEITDLLPGVVETKPDQDQGSIIIVVATDAPLLPHQLKRLARRASMGLARTGSVAGNSSGDIFIAFSTANGATLDQNGITKIDMLANDRMDELFEATAQATEESIINAMIAAETMKGINDRVVHALPQDRLLEVLKKYHRL